MSWPKKKGTCTRYFGVKGIIKPKLGVKGPMMPKSGRDGLYDAIVWRDGKLFNSRKKKGQIGFLRPELMAFGGDLPIFILLGILAWFTRLDDSNEDDDEINTSLEEEMEIENKREEQEKQQLILDQKREKLLQEKQDLLEQEKQQWCDRHIIHVYIT